MTYSGNTASVKRCKKPNCKQTFPNHHWGAKAAQKAGWFLQRNGDNWCPSHNPDWVAEWRKKKSDARSQGRTNSS